MYNKQYKDKNSDIYTFSEPVRALRTYSLSGGLVLLWEKVDMDVWKNTTSSDGSIFHESGELLVVSDGELDVSWDDSALLVVFGGVTCELKDLSGEVLKDGGKIDWGTGTNSLGVSASLEESGDSSNWELKSSLG